MLMTQDLVDRARPARDPAGIVNHVQFFHQGLYGQGRELCPRAGVVQIDQINRVRIIKDAYRFRTGAAQVALAVVDDCDATGARAPASGLANRGFK